MSQASNPPPYQPAFTQVIVQPQPSNGLGVAGFVISLLGVVTCGFLSPLGLLFSLIGLAKAPRGLAIAGTVLGLFGSVWLFAAGFVMILGILGMGRAASSMVNDVSTRQAAARAATVIVRHRDATGSLPTDAEGTEIASESDAWHKPFRYERQAKSFAIISAGPDQKFGTSDDLVLTEAELIAPTSRASNSPGHTADHD